MGRKGGTENQSPAPATLTPLRPVLPRQGRRCVPFQKVRRRSVGTERGGVASDSTRPARIPYFAAMPPRRRTSKDTPAKLASRMKRRWRVVLIRSKGELLGYVDATDAQGAEAAAAEQFRARWMAGPAVAGARIGVTITSAAFGH